MVDAAAAANAKSLELELDWFSHVLEARLRLYFDRDGAQGDITTLTPPDLAPHESPYGNFVEHYELGFEERLITALCLIPHVRPQLLDPLLIKNAELDRAFTEFGGAQGRSHGGFLPTGETALFLIAGDDLGERLQALPLLGATHFFSKHGVLGCRPASPNEPSTSGQLQLSPEFLDYFTTGRATPPAFSEDFPARKESDCLRHRKLRLKTWK